MGYVEIMSYEEAMKLPQSKRPLNCRLPSKIYHNVWASIGQASRCGPNANNDLSDIVVDLCFSIADELERLGITTEQMRANSVPDSGRVGTCEGGIKTAEERPGEISSSAETIQESQSAEKETDSVAGPSAGQCDDILGRQHYSK